MNRRDLRADINGQILAHAEALCNAIVSFIAAELSGETLEQLVLIPSKLHCYFLE